MLISELFSIFVYMNIYEKTGEINYLIEPLGSLQEIIALKHDNLPKDKRTKEYQVQKNEYNDIVAIYNKRAKHKIYNKIK